VIVHKWEAQKNRRDNERERHFPVQYLPVGLIFNRRKNIQFDALCAAMYRHIWVPGVNLPNC